MIVGCLFLLSGCATSKDELILNQITLVEGSENVEILTMVTIDDSVAVISKTQGGPVKKWLFYLSDYRIRSSYPPEELKSDEIQLATQCDQKGCDSILFINAEKLRAVDLKYEFMNNEKSTIVFHQELSQGCYILVNRIPHEYNTNPEIIRYDVNGNSLT